MLLINSSNTLSIGEWAALQWQNDSDNRQEEANDEHLLEGNGNGTRTPSKKLRKPPEVLSLNEFFSSLPKVESHYCRKRTAKLYLEPTWRSKS